MEDRMTRLLLTAALLCVAVPAIAQPATAPAPSDPPCLVQRNIYDFKTVPGNRSLIAIDRSRLRYRVNFMGICQNLQYHLGVAFKTNGTGNLSCISRGDSVIIRDAVTPVPCIIKDIQYQTVALDQADAAAAAAAKAKQN